MLRLIDRLARIATSGLLAAGIAAAAAAALPGTAAAAATDQISGTAAGPPHLSDADKPLREAQAAQPPARPPAAGAGDQQVERQIGDLRRRLNITAAQQGQFEALAQAMRQNAQEAAGMMQQEQQAGGGRARGAVEDLRAAAQLADAQAAGLRRLLPPLEALYAGLSDQQKRTADQVLGQQQKPPRR
jgi:hypothetical protein